MPEPHILLMVAAPVEAGRPAPRAACRAGAWPMTGGKHAAEENFVDGVRRNACALDGGADGGSAELGSGEIFEIALECADGRARGADNDDGIGGGHGCSFHQMRQRGRMLQRGGHAQRAVEADGFAVEHGVFDRCGLTSAANSAGRPRRCGKGNAFGERVLHFLRECRPSWASRRFPARW